MDAASIFSMISGVGDSFQKGYDDARAPAIFDRMISGAGAASAPAASASGFADSVGSAYKPGSTPAAPSFAASGGAMGDYLASTRARESGGNDLAANPNSTAKGRYQFTDQTWAGVARRHPDLGLTPGGWRDPAQQEKAMVAFTGDNAKALTAAGLPINPTNLYGSHFLGEAGGPKFIAGAMQNPDQLATGLVSPGQVRANRTVFFGKDGRPKTAGEVYAWMGGAKAPTAAPTMVASAEPDAANLPAQGAIPAGFSIPGQDAPAPTVPTMPAQSGAGLGGRFSPDQIATLREAYRNPNTRPMATQILSSMLQGKDASWSVVDLGQGGKALFDARTARMVPIPGTGNRSTATVGGNLVDANTGEVLFTAPDKESNKLQTVAPGQVLYDPVTRQPVYSAPNKAEGFTLAPGQTRYEGGQPVASAPDRDKTAEGEARLRGEFSKQLGAFGDVHDAYGRVIAAVKNREGNPSATSPASDIALVFGYMKMLDPGSVVREGEYATAKNAAGVPEQVRNTFNKLMNGEFLAPEQRQDFVDTAGRVYGQAREQAEGVATRYRDLATGQGLDVNRVVALPNALQAPAVATPRKAAPKAEGATPAPEKPSRFGQVPIPMQAVTALRADPSLRDQFDRKYGKGASDRALGPAQRTAPGPVGPATLDPSLGLQ